MYVCKFTLYTVYIVIFLAKEIVPFDNNNNKNNSSYKAHNTAIACLCAGKEEC